MTDPQLSIGQVAQRLGISDRTLRYYEEVGLITPGGHSPGGCRRYCAQDIERVAHIRELQEVMGYSLEEIQRILSARNQLDTIGTARASVSASEDQHQLLEEAFETLELFRTRVRAKLERLERISAELEATAALYKGPVGAPSPGTWGLGTPVAGAGPAAGPSTRDAGP
ncbi:MAG: MerR family transcriptional regulator [Acidimicrobiales bacterium]